MHVKICGLTNRGDADRAVEAGADYVGCVLVPGTPRHVDADHARTILHGHPGDVTGVLVFREPTVDEVTDAIRRSGLITVQLHKTADDVVDTLLRMGIVVHRALDANSRSVPDVPTEGALLHHLDVEDGGSGRTFDWETLLSPRAPERTFIAGGLNPENLPRLLRYHPFGIDVSSGLESEPGIKCPELMARFFEVIAKRRELGEVS